MNKLQKALKLTGKFVLLLIITLFTLPFIAVGAGIGFFLISPFIYACAGIRLSIDSANDYLEDVVTTNKLRRKL